MIIDVDEYKSSVASYDKWTGQLDEVLYDLCRKSPGHADHSGVAAKCWMIGRTYATGIERKISSRGSQGSSMEQLVDLLVKHGNEVDDLIAPLRSLKGPLTPEALEMILSAHGRFLRVLEGVVRKNQTPRSFASKYFHFHCPLVPIYDSVVARVIPGLVRWNSSLVVFLQPDDADDEYAWFCYRFWKLYSEARAKFRSGVTVKLLDYHLLCLGGAPA